MLSAPDPPAPPRRRARLRAGVARVLLWLAPVALLAATVTVWVRFEVADDAALSRHVRAALQAPPVRDELSRRLARAVAEADPRLVSVEPLLQSTAAALIDSRPFADAVDVAVQSARRAVTRGRAADATRLEDIETQFVTVVAAFDADLAERIPRGWDTGIVDLRPESPVARGLRFSERWSWMWPWVAAGAAATLIGAVGLARRRRRALVVCGLQVAAVGLALVAVRAWVASRVTGAAADPDTGVALQAAFDVVTASWRTIGLGDLVAGGVIVAASASGAFVAALLAGGGTALRRVARPPAHPAGAVAWALGAVALGLVVVGQSRHLGPALAVAAGVALAFAGTRVLARALPDAAATATPARRARRGLAALPVAGLTLLAVPVVLWAGVRPTGGSDETRLACNGHAVLCERRVDEVVFAGTHNSMAAIDQRFLLAEQRGDIAAQLEGGVRALLVDTHYGRASTTGPVLTELDATGEPGGEDPTAALRATIDQLRRNLVPTAGPPRVYLCHQYCELGATPAEEAFAGIRAFLEGHPSEVLVLIVQDETSAADTVAALRAAGLDRMAYAHPDGAEWPTLGELVRRATPLLVFFEDQGGAPPWVHRAFQHMQDTTFRAYSPAGLTCTRNRGSRDAPLFLLNHWVDTDPPSVAPARTVNAEAFIVERARRCEAERGRKVNIVAVNFWQTGGLLAAVDVLNEVAS